LYILFSSTNKKVYRSGNLGQNWDLVAPSVSGVSLTAGESDSNNNLYAGRGNGEVWKSSDRGINWVLQGDANRGESEAIKGIAINSSNTIFVVDAKGRVIMSLNGGMNWTEKTNAYGGGSSTDDMKVDSLNNLYILLDKKIYKSDDEGVNWVIVNNSLTSYSNDGAKMSIDSKDNIFVTDTNGRVFKSVDSGVSWKEISDFNGELTNSPTGLTNFLVETRLSFQGRNCSLSDCSDGVWQSLDLDNLNLQGRYFQYKVLFESSDSFISPFLESVNIDYTILNTPPIITLIEPSEGTTYGYNESIALKFLIEDNEGDKESCWYNIINEGENITIFNCENTTFSVPENGEYLLTIYVNDSLGEQTSDSASFQVSLGAPTIVLHSPSDKSYISYSEIDFVYTPSDIDLDSCELWGDFTGDFILNQTEYIGAGGSGIENNFTLTLPDGNYKWNIWCNDAEGNSAFNGNRTFYVDTTPPSTTISEPKGKKTSRIGIPLTFSVVDASPITCWYNIYRGINIEISNTSINCSETSYFNVTVDADFTLNFYAKDNANNFNYTSTSFNVDTSAPEIPGRESSGGSGGSFITSPISLSKLNIEKINVIVLPGEERSLQINVKNEGRTSANKCRLTTGENYSKYIESKDIKNIGIGELVEFNFILKALGKEVNKIILYIECLDNISAIVPLSITLLENKLDISIKEILIESDNLLVKYNINTNIDSVENIYFRILNSAGGSVQEVLEKVTMKSDEIYNGEVKISLSEAEEGMLKLSVTGDNKEVVFIEEDFIYSGKTLFTGYTLLNTLLEFSYIGIVLIVFLVLVFIIGKRIWKLKKIIK
jgi:photosystem II stability/assembly factor-like uncharacterized protein